MTNDPNPLSQYIESRIRAIFTDVAEMVANGDITVSEEESAGVPFMLFIAEHDLVEKWRRIVRGPTG